MGRCDLGRFLLNVMKVIRSLGMSLDSVVQGFEKHCFANFCLSFVLPLAEFAFWAKRIHGAESVLVVDVFVRHN